MPIISNSILVMFHDYFKAKDQKRTEPKLRKRMKLTTLMSSPRASVLSDDRGMKEAKHMNHLA